jgi:hypothetical protein
MWPAQRRHLHWWDMPQGGLRPSAQLRHEKRHLRGLRRRWTNLLGSERHLQWPRKIWSVLLIITSFSISILWFLNGPSGYNEVLRIPAGAANVDITQTAYNGQSEDDNYLVLRLPNGEWLLNGQYQVSVFRHQIPIQDTVLEVFCKLG